MSSRPLQYWRSCGRCVGARLDVQGSLCRVDPCAGPYSVRRLKSNIGPRYRNGDLETPDCAIEIIWHPLDSEDDETTADANKHFLGWMEQVCPGQECRHCRQSWHLRPRQMLHAPHMCLLATFPLCETDIAYRFLPELFAYLPSVAAWSAYLPLPKPYAMQPGQTDSNTGIRKGSKKGSNVAQLAAEVFACHTSTLLEMTWPDATVATLCLEQDCAAWRCVRFQQSWSNIMQDETFADLLRLYEADEVSFRNNAAAFGMLDIGLRVVDMKTQQRKLNKCLAARSMLHSTQERVAQSKQELAAAAKLQKAVQAFHVAFCSWRGV